MALVVVWKYSRLVLQCGTKWVLLRHWQLNGSGFVGLCLRHRSAAPAAEHSLG